MTSPPTRTEHTRRRLMDAALESFARKGVHETRVDDICELSGTARATFYRHFDGKSEVFGALFDEMAAELQRIADDLGPVGPDAAGWETLRRLVDDMLAMSLHWAPVLASLSGAVSGDDAVRERSIVLAAEFCRTVGARLGDGGVTGVDRQLAALAVIALVEGVGQQLRTWSIDVDRDEVVDLLALQALAMLHADADTDQLLALVAR